LKAGDGRVKKEALLLASAIHSTATDRACPQPRDRLFRLGFALWTALVILALWWLLRSGSHDGGGATWVMHEGDSPKSLIERTRDWFRLAHLNFQRIYPWVLFGPYVAWLVSRFPLERGRLRVNVPVHVLACALFATASQLINSRIHMTVARVVVYNSYRHTEGPPAGEEVRSVHLEVSQGPPDGSVPGHFAGTLISEDITNHLVDSRPGSKPHDPDSASLTNLLTKFEHSFNPGLHPPGLPTLRPLAIGMDLLAYAAIVGLAHSVHFYRRYREREHRALFLESSLAQSQLRTLRAQLQPHFLFNTLNAIATLLRRDPRAAEATLTSLSELLRLTLGHSERQEMTLREELEFLNCYLEIQQTRFGDRLRFEQTVDPAALDCLVPTLLLQPLVENAIRHGIEPADHTGTVRVTAARRDGRLVLSVQDDGVGLSVQAKGQGGTGIGLSNLRARLEALYGPDHKLELTSAAGAGVVVNIEVPWRQVATIESPAQPVP
jgi:two-component system, LytTR family, sensor kinase